jgi:hypothetical protein
MNGADVMTRSTVQLWYASLRREQPVVPTLSNLDSTCQFHAAGLSRPLDVSMYSHLSAVVNL